MSRRYSRCGTCHRRQPVKRDGGLFKHTRGYGPNPGDLPICEGSGTAAR
jgi:hypothetical protein